MFWLALLAFTSLEKPPPPQPQWKCVMVMQGTKRIEVLPWAVVENGVIVAGSHIKPPVRIVKSP